MNNRTNYLLLSQPARYQIEIQGRHNENWSDWMDDLEIKTIIRDNRLVITKCVIRGEGLNLFAKGNMELDTLYSDFTVLIAPLKTLDAIVGSMPLVGPAVGGKNTALVAIPVGVKGNIANPEVTILPAQAVGEGIVTLVQETFKRLWMNRKKLDPNKKIKAYLYKIAKNIIIEHERRQQREKKYRNSLAHNSEHESVEQISHIYVAINNLPTILKQVFVLNRVEGLKYSEIAQVIGISIKTVESRMSRALKILMKELSDFN